MKSTTTKWNEKIKKRRTDEQTLHELQENGLRLNRRSASRSSAGQGKRNRFLLSQG
jgi:hypothetical protein